MSFFFLHASYSSAETVAFFLMRKLSQFAQWEPLSVFSFEIALDHFGSIFSSWQSIDATGPSKLSLLQDIESDTFQGFLVPFAVES